MGNKDSTLTVYYPNLSLGSDFESLVMGAILFRFLGHQADIWNRSHCCRIESTMLPTKIDGGQIDPGVAAIRNNREGILCFTISIPHLTGSANHGRHRGINNDITGHMKIGYSLVGIDHGQRGSVFISRLDVGFNLGFLFSRQLI